MKYIDNIRYFQYFCKNEIFINMKNIKNKPMIEYLDIDERFYIENDRVKLHLNETSIPQEGTWEDVWGDVIKIIEKAKQYDEEHNINKIHK